MEEVPPPPPPAEPPPVLRTTILSCVADLVYVKTQTLLVILRTQNQPHEVSCVFLEVSWMCKKQTAVSHSSTKF